MEMTSNLRTETITGTMTGARHRSCGLRLPPPAGGGSRPLPPLRCVFNSLLGDNVREPEKGAWKHARRRAVRGEGPAFNAPLRKEEE